MTTQERVRNAIAATAAQVDPASIPPLDLVPTTRPFWAGSGRRARPWLRLFVPMTAATALAVVIVVSLAISAVLHQHKPGSSPPPGTSTGPPGTSVSPRAGVPRFYVTLTHRSTPRFTRPLSVTLRATATGLALFRIAPTSPHDTFSGVTAAADDRTFVLAENNGWYPVAKNGSKQPRMAVRFYLLKVKVSHGTAIYRLTRLPILLPSEAQIQGIALSPDGTRLAVAAGGNLLRVFTIRTGAVRTWSAAGPGVRGGWMTGLSWTANGRYLGFDTINWHSLAGNWHSLADGRFVSLNGLRVLDTSKTGTSLVADSRLLLRFQRPGLTCADDAVLAPDGKVIACGLIQGMAGSQRLSGYGEFSAATGRLIRRMDVTDRRGQPVIVWLSPSGDSFIAQPYYPNSPLLLISQRPAATMTWPHPNYIEQDSISNAGWAW